MLCECPRRWRDAAVYAQCGLIGRVAQEEEGGAQDGDDGRQAAAEHAEAPGRQHHPGHRGGQHLPGRVGHPLHQPQGCALGAGWWAHAGRPGKGARAVAERVQVGVSVAVRTSAAAQRWATCRSVGTAAETTRSLSCLEWRREGRRPGRCGSPLPSCPLPQCKPPSQQTHTWSAAPRRPRTWRVRGSPESQGPAAGSDIAGSRWGFERGDLARRLEGG